MVSHREERTSMLYYKFANKYLGNYSNLTRTKNADVDKSAYF